MALIALIIVALGTTYMVALVQFTSGLRALIRTWQPNHPERPPTVSVVIPARNESGAIQQCVDSVLVNDYPKEQVGILVVDDGSDDGTAEIVSDLQERTNRLRLIRLDTRTGGGKKKAIQAGIAASDGEIILLTDADTEVSRHWIRTMVSAFSPETQFVSAPVAYRIGSGWLDRLLELEMLGLVAVGAGAIALGRPTMCNGANIAFRRAAFGEIGGYDGTEHLTSGDDELLMHKMAKRHPGSVAFCPDPAALVSTAAPRKLRSLFQQRRRWASKAFHYRDKRITLLALLVYVLNFTLLVAAVASIWVGPIRPAFLIAMALKLSAEGWMLWTVCSHFERRDLMRGMLAGQLFEIPYVVVTGAAGTAGGYRWKGRDIRR